MKDIAKTTFPSKQGVIDGYQKSFVCKYKGDKLNKFKLLFNKQFEQSKDFSESLKVWVDHFLTRKSVFFAGNGSSDEDANKTKETKDMEQTESEKNAIIFFFQYTKKH